MDKGSIGAPAGLRGEAEVVAAIWSQALAACRGGQSDLAVLFCQRLLAIMPAHADALHLLGFAALLRGDADGALRFFLRSTVVDDSNAEHYNNLSAAAHRCGRTTEALAACRRALALQPHFTEAWTNLGLILQGCGDFDSAQRAFANALKITPSSAEAFNNLGHLLHSLGRHGDAAISCHRATLLNPGFAEAFNNLGTASARNGAQGRAEASYWQALAIRPTYAEALNNLGALLQEQGRVQEALVCFDRAVAVSPGFGYGQMNRIFTRLYLPQTSPADMLAEASAWNERRPACDPAVRPIASGDGMPRRIGFVSADFRQHAVGYLALPTVEALAGRGYEVFCYSNSAREDEVTARFRRAAQWRPILGLSDEAVARRIAADGIDILFDLSGFSADNRLEVFTLRPAPVQVAWLGYPATTGMAAMDYILADRWQFPPGHEAFYTEKAVRLPHSYVVYDSPHAVPEGGALPARSAGVVTFGSFNALKKIPPTTVGVWARILGKVPGSRLVMKTPALSNEEARAYYSTLFAAHGIGAERLRFLGGSTPAEHQAAMAEADLALDSFPYAGGLTTLDCLWMGVPVITCPGQTFCSRHSFGYLSTLGLTELIATDLDHYVEMAVDLATDLSSLATLRGGLRRRMVASALCDVDRFVGDLESALRGMWRRRYDGLPPAPIEVTAGPTTPFIGWRGMAFALNHRLTSPSGYSTMKLVPVTRESHGAKRLRPMTTFAHTAGTAAVEVVFGEISQVAANYPMFFVRQPDGVKLVAMLGTTQGENLYVDAAGRWTGLYVPVVFRTYPFTLGRKEQGGELALLIDEESGLLSDTEGELLFGASETEANPPIERVLQMLTTVATDGQRTLEMVKQLDQYGLLKPASLKVDRQGGEAQQLEGVLSIDEAGLNALSDEQFLALRRSGALALAYAQMFSLSQFTRLQAKLTQRGSGAANTAL